LLSSNDERLKLVSSNNDSIGLFRPRHLTVPTLPVQVPSSGSSLPPMCKSSLRDCAKVLAKGGYATLLKNHCTLPRGEHKHFHPMMKACFHPRMKVTLIFLFVAFGACSNSLRAAPVSIHLKNWCSTAASFLCLEGTSAAVATSVVRLG
jgi:hypothetical protein